jgi:hypothetical protein
MDPLLIPVIVGTFALFFLGIWLSRMSRSRLQSVALALFSFLAAIPAILYVVYYTGVLGEVIWFYAFRAMPGAELAVCGAGLLAGWLQAARSRSPQISRQMSVGFIPFILLLRVTIPYLKQIFLRPDWNNFNDRWSGNVCLQSSESSCGPASTATLLKLLGKPASERHIASESFTSRRGTENWYLIRTMRRHGLDAKYSTSKPGDLDFSAPAIVGVRLDSKTGAGHFIAVLGKAGDRFVVGDPLVGREEMPEAELLARYYFTGFSILVSATN